jgi:hypothetical protein
MALIPTGNTVSKVQAHSTRVCDEVPCTICCVNVLLRFLIAYLSYYDT